MGFFGWERKVFWTSILVRWGFPGGTIIKKLTVNAGSIRDVGLITGSGRSPEGGQSNPLQYSCMEKPMVRGAWRTTVHRVTKSQTQLNDLARIGEMIDSHRQCFCMCLKLRKLNFRCLKMFIIIIIIIKRTGCGKERSPESHHQDRPLQDT